MVVWNATKLGLKRSLKLCIKICKIIIPVYFLVEILKFSGLLNYISIYFEGVMSIFGLPGEAVLVLLLGNGINIYAAIAALEPLALTIREVTILSAMLCISHSLAVETSIIKTLKLAAYKQLILRIGISLTLGIILNLIWR